jgi:hypothetical protein
MEVVSRHMSDINDYIFEEETLNTLYNIKNVSGQTNDKNI